MSFISLRGRRSKGRQRRSLEEKNAIVGRGKGTAVSTPLFLSFRLLSNYAKPESCKILGGQNDHKQYLAFLKGWSRDS